MYKVELLDFSEQGIEQCATLLQSVYPHAKHIHAKYLHWQYNLNPDGKAVGFNAFKDGDFAAHYVTIPITSLINGKQEKGLLSLNTATHANHRGKGLFTQLADATYHYAAENGFQFVIGVANANSTHGFTKKLGFQLISPLQAMIGTGAIRMKQEKRNYDYERIWTEETLQWRLDNSIKQYVIKKNKTNWMISCEYKMGISAIIASLDECFQLQRHENMQSPIKLWIGLDNNVDWKNSFYFNIPSRFRSAPLNLIFKDLSRNNRQLNKSSIKFQLLDFDVL